MKNLNMTRACRQALEIMLSIPDPAHCVEHVVRVYDWSRKLAEFYPELDLKVLKMAAYWHDVGRKKQSTKKDDHNIKSGEMVRAYLMNYQVKKSFIDQVEQAVIDHSFTCQPKSIEGKIIHDADKLAYLGDHELLDVFEGFDDGFGTDTFDKPMLIKTLKFLVEDVKGSFTYLYQGLILPESKKIFKAREKKFRSIVKNLEKRV